MGIEARWLKGVIFVLVFSSLSLIAEECFLGLNFVNFHESIDQPLMVHSINTLPGVLLSQYCGPLPSLEETAAAEGNKLCLL